MSSRIVDGRLRGKGGSTGQKERFYRRAKPYIDKAVQDAVKNRGTGDFEKGQDISIPKKDLSQPVFDHGDGGRREIIHPGNTEYLTGDRIKRPEKGGGKGQGGKGGDDIGDDDFIFHLSKEALMRHFFDRLKLPNLMKTMLAEIPDFSWHRAGFVSTGAPNNLSVVRSMRGALARRIALGAGARTEIAELDERIGTLAEKYAQAAGRPDTDPDRVALFNDLAAVKERRENLQDRLDRIPYLDPIDLKYRNRVKIPRPSTKALMICMMDVSGSMNEERKQRAKIFNILLNLFLKRHYEDIEILFLRYHSKAAVVAENEFYHGTETGGTNVGNGLELLLQTIRQKTAAQDCNVYVAHSSDGDSGDGMGKKDTTQSKAWLGQIMPLVQYYAYMQVTKNEKDLWPALKSVAADHPGRFGMALAESDDQIYLALSALFEGHERPVPKAALSPHQP